MISEYKTLDAQEKLPLNMQGLLPVKSYLFCIFNDGDVIVELLMMETVYETLLSHALYVPPPPLSFI